MSNRQLTKVDHLHITSIFRSGYHRHKVLSTLYSILFVLVLSVATIITSTTATQPPATATTTSASSSATKKISLKYKDRLSTSAEAIEKMDVLKVDNNDNNNNNSMKDDDDNSETIAIVFSDLDGTLIHYPKNVNEFVQRNDGRGIITLPSSKTGMVGCVSTKTFTLCNMIRRQKTKHINTSNTISSLNDNMYDNDNVNKDQQQHHHHHHKQQQQQKTPIRLVFVSGMRSSTLLSRIPFLPKADVYCCDSGGRIFYSRPFIVNNFMTTNGIKYDYTIQQQSQQGTNDKGTDSSVIYYRRKVLRPLVQISSDGSDDKTNSEDDDMEPFVLEEDLEWRRRMEFVTAAGTDGFVGNEAIATTVVSKMNNNNDFCESIIDDTRDTEKSETTIPVPSRHGIVWEYATALQQAGFVLDLDGYSTCFRINRKHQHDLGRDLFDQLLLSLSTKTVPSINTSIPTFPFQYLASSINLGCIDIYPITSGKKNCCAYLAQKLINTDMQIIDTNITTNDDNNKVGTTPEKLLASHCVCLCDDDNDIEMALACSHAYLPSISSTRMKEIVQQHSNHFTVTFNDQHYTDDDDDDDDDDNNAVDYTVATEQALSLLLERIRTQQ